MRIFQNIRGWIQRWVTFTDNRAVLSYIIEVANPKAELSERIEWLEQLINWIRYSGSISNESLKDSGQLHSARIRFIFQILERNPEWRSKVAHTLRSILQETSGVSLYSETGLADEFGFGAEVFSRITRKMLPVPPNHADLAQVFARLFNSVEDAAWVRRLPPEVREQLTALLYDGTPIEIARIKKSFSDDISDALLILGAKVESLGIAPEIRNRLVRRRIEASPFVKIHRALTNLNSNNQLEALLLECKKDIQDVYIHLDTLGISVAVVYRLDIIVRSLERMSVLAAVLGKLPSESDLVSKFIASLIQENIRKNSVRELLKDQLRLLAKKIVERTGVSGEHYIARDRKEWLHMLSSAGGGGFLTVFTAFIKILIIRMALAPFFEGSFYWINYSSSFLLMQAMGFTLATKQPSATAPALAGKLKEIEQEHQLDQFVDEVIRIVRSQFAAAVGNIGVVIPGCILLGLGYQQLFGHSFLTNVEADHVVRSFNPFKTLTILQASLTGVLLWVSSVSGGWLENWVVYNQISEAIAQSRNLNIVFGKKRCEAFAKAFLKNIAGIGTNLTLGFTLAFTPIITGFFGFALEAKHVTLSSGALSFAVISLPREQLDPSTLGLAFLGIAFVGILNFGVSFFLAIFVAQRAREVPLFWLVKLFKAVRQRFLKHPFAFFFAPVQSNLD